jgi:hypothetical protein
VNSSCPRRQFSGKAWRCQELANSPQETTPHHCRRAPMAARLDYAEVDRRAPQASPCRRQDTDAPVQLRRCSSPHSATHQHDVTIGIGCDMLSRLWSLGARQARTCMRAVLITQLRLMSPTFLVQPEISKLRWSTPRVLAWIRFLRDRARRCWAAFVSLSPERRNQRRQSSMLHQPRRETIPVHLASVRYAMVRARLSEDIQQLSGIVQPSAWTGDPIEFRAEGPRRRLQHVQSRCAKSAS